MKRSFVDYFLTGWRLLPPLAWLTLNAPVVLLMAYVTLRSRVLQGRPAGWPR